MSEENNEYRNKLILNQRGGSIEVNNSTEREEIKLSQYSGSNISINNIVTSELATNNKQTKVNSDSFESIGNDKNVYVGRDYVTRVVEDSYTIKGFENQEQLDKVKEWRESFREIALKNSKFLIQRGGESIPNGTTSEQSGNRGSNSTLNQTRAAVENTFNGFSGIPKRTSNSDEVSTYVTVIDRGNTQPAKQVEPKPIEDISKGNVVYPEGYDKNSSTERGSWVNEPDHESLNNDILQKQEELNDIERKMGNSGDEIVFIKRHKIETIGAVNNDYPTIRVDKEGRSQPVEVAVGENLTFVNVGKVPHVEEINNDINFPVGDYTLNVGNRYNVHVGSGGINMKTSGSIEIGSTTLKLASNKINIQSENGVNISSEGFVELQSIESISLRSNKQVFIEPGLGVKNNLIVSGGTYIEGETFLHHITAPVEIQETEDTTLFGKFATDNDRQLLIGEAYVAGVWWPVYAKSSDNLIANYPHSHHFKNIPLRLLESNKDVRTKAIEENINVNGNYTAAIEQIHERK